MSMVYRFTFSPSVSDGQIESRLFLAAVNTEILQPLKGPADADED